MKLKTCPMFDEYYGMEIDATIHCREPKCNGVLIVQDAFPVDDGHIAFTLACSECHAGFGVQILTRGE